MLGNLLLITNNKVISYTCRIVRKGLWSEFTASTITGTIELKFNSEKFEVGFENLFKKYDPHVQNFFQPLSIWRFA